MAKNTVLKTGVVVVATVCAAILSLGLILHKSHRHAACKLVISSAYPCDANGAPYKPRVGDTGYYVRVNWTVSGSPISAYTVRFKEANFTRDWANVDTPNPGDYHYINGFEMPYDGKVPYSITLDPDNVSGNTNEAHNTISSSFTPIPPTTALEYYDTKRITGSETFTVNWMPGIGSVTTGETLLGSPVSDTFQTVVSSVGPAGSVLIKCKPTDDPVWKNSYANYKPSLFNSNWTATSNFVVDVSSVRVNPNKLQAVKWSSFAKLPVSVEPYLKADTLVQSTDPKIIAFVKSVLPSTYKKTMSPYSAARKLFLAVVERTSYKHPADPSSVATLVGKSGDCGGFSDLYAACLLAIGIPARTDCGWWKGTDQWHAFNEFYLPGIGWIPADASEDCLQGDPSGKYAFRFGDDPCLNNICIVSRATSHETSGIIASETQLGWFVYHGNASLIGQSDTCSLK